jgi:hypothetical protein
MEVLKKNIKLLMTTGITTNCNKDCFIFIPDLTVNYNIKFGLTQEAHDFGFFDAYIPETGITSQLGVEIGNEE